MAAAPSTFTTRARADDDRAGVSASMRGRIAAALDAGQRPRVMTSGMVRLGGDTGPILVGADLREKPAGVELRRQLERAPAGVVDTTQFSIDRWLRNGPEVVPATTQRRGGIWGGRATWPQLWPALGGRCGRRRGRSFVVRVTLLNKLSESGST